MSFAGIGRVRRRVIYNVMEKFDVRNWVQSEPGEFWTRHHAVGRSVSNDLMYTMPSTC